MKPVKALLLWLETYCAVPAYGGWVLIGLTVCFWLAAANTMAGWLYVLSGLGAALLLLSATMPGQALKGIEITRSSLLPVHVGGFLWVNLYLRNRTTHGKGLLLVGDQVPKALGESPEGVVEAIAPHQTYTWHYCLEPQRRGLYQWKKVMLRSGTPLGLFWSRRVHLIQAKVFVYPRVLPLARCPILDDMGPSAQQRQQVPQARTGNEGSTRSLRPYRWGDPIRMVHWRSSARFNTLRVRELETVSGGYTFIIALDTGCHWHSDTFEQAVVAAASLLRHATQQHGTAQLWTPQLGLVHGIQQGLEVLAQIEPQSSFSIERTLGAQLSQQPTLWLTANPESIPLLPTGSRYLLWPQIFLDASAQTQKSPSILLSQAQLGIQISSEVPLQSQLQTPLRIEH
jgi:uncharacterized protein (DUF58 family)